MIRECDNTSVGVIVVNDAEEVLLINRARFPFGYAAPAGHIDTHGTPEQAAVTEVYEETGLRVSMQALEKVIDARRINNQCRRPGGNHHVWTVFVAKSISNALNPSPAETRGAQWWPHNALQSLSRTTRNHAAYAEGNAEHFLERVWLDFLTETGFVDE